MPEKPELNTTQRLFNALGFYWRWIATAMSFALFGIGSFLLGFVIIPLVVHLVRDKERRIRWSRLLAGRAMRSFLFFMNTVGVLRYKISGRENIDPDRNYLIVANHPSLIDVVFLLSLFPTADCVIKHELRENFWTKHLMKGVGYISNRDPTSWLNNCVARLEEGHSLILFPEGTRTIPGQPLNFKAGAAAVAVRSGACCLPILIQCTPATLTKAERWYQVPERRVLYSLSIEPPIETPDSAAAPLDERLASRSFNQRLHSFFTSRLESGSAAAS